MLSWLTQATVAFPNELVVAERSEQRRTAINRYRSRTEVTTEHIHTAYSWLRLPLIVNNELQEYDTRSMLYKTLPVSRGVSEDEALSTIQREINSIIHGYYSQTITMLNTSTAAANSAKVKEWPDNAEEWTELTEARTTVVSTPNHKINIYRNDTETCTNYVILNNMDTPTVVFKIAAAIMMNMNHFGDDTERFAQAWLSGNGDTICTLVENYYKEYKEYKINKQREEALEAMCKAMVVDRSNEFRNRIDEIQHNIDMLFAKISEYSESLDKAKGEFLLYTLENEEDKGEELRNFIASCGDKISHIRFSNNKLYLVYRTSLIYFEPEMLERYFESTRDNCVNTAYSAKQQLLKDIFINQTYELLIESGACLNLGNNSVCWTDPINLLPNGYDAMVGIPNPHHIYYNCWGDNQSNIVRALRDKDYITAILTTFAAISGLNIADSAVIEKFVRQELENTAFRNIRCLKNKETGELININQYIRRYEDASNETN